MDEVKSADQGQAEAAPCPCKVELQPMAKWVKVADSGSCRPCTIAPVASWYHSELTERGKKVEADRLEAKVNSMNEDNPDDVVALCEEMDKIKGEVDVDTKKRLEDFDCAAQTYDPNEVVEESSPS